MSEKRKRCANFSLNEKIMCLNVIKKYKHIIESKETGALSWKEKEHTWKMIEREFNAHSDTYRSLDVIKRFYTNKKKDTRKCAANNRAEYFGTGGGAPIPATIVKDPTFELTLDILNKKTVVGLENKFDSDMVSTYCNFLLMY